MLILPRHFRESQKKKAIKKDREKGMTGGRKKDTKKDMKNEGSK
jgi:hypothetical protein